jgi:hypothetical protein
VPADELDASVAPMHDKSRFSVRSRTDSILLCIGFGRRTTLRLELEPANRLRERKDGGVLAKFRRSHENSRDSFCFHR